MKKPNEVARAEEIERLKKAEFDAAKEQAARLESEWHAAIDGAQAARIAADSSLPQCGMVQTCWYGSPAEDFGRVVILRQTPSGMLVVRRIGDREGDELKFKLERYSGKYVQAKKRDAWVTKTFELLDVPECYLRFAAQVQEEKEPK